MIVSEISECNISEINLQAQRYELKSKVQCASEQLCLASRLSNMIIDREIAQKLVRILLTVYQSQMTDLEKAGRRQADSLEKIGACIQW